MNGWLPIAIAIFAFAALSGALRRRFAPLRGERRLSRKGASVYFIGVVVLVTFFLIFAVGLIATMAKR